MFKKQKQIQSVQSVGESLHVKYKIFKISKGTGKIYIVKGKNNLVPRALRVRASLTRRALGTRLGEKGGVEYSEHGTLDVYTE